MAFIQAIQRLPEGEDLIEIWAILVEPIQFPEFLCHFIKRSLKPVMAFTIHLGITMSKYSNQPTLHRLYVAQTRTGSIGLKESLLG